MPEVGQTIAQFRILEKIGQGGMGEVFLAEDTSLDRKVALKFLPPDMQHDEVAHQRFLREAKSAAALDHPYICNIYEANEVEGSSFIVMEHVEGQTLREKLKGGPLELEEAIRIAAEIADALELAHQKGIIHRDLKPANIMLTPQGHAKVMDFGLAKKMVPQAGTEQDVSTGLTQESSTLGTPAYMSPEQVRAQQLDHRTDIFSFGIIFYEMLTGVHPFRRALPVETTGAILHEEPDPVVKYVPASTDQLQETVRGLLAKNRDERIQTIGEVARRCIELSTTGKELGLAAFLRSQVGKRLVLVLTAALAITVIGWWAFQNGSGETNAPTITSIAVLPLANMSGDPEQEYFVDGMTEALITDLSKIGALKVISRSSAMLYKDTDKPPAEIARELNVEALIEGSLLREGDRVGITAQMIEAATGHTLWAERYERSLTSILTLQGEVAQAIAREIQVTLTPEEQDLLSRKRTVIPEAYEAYLKGKAQFYKLTAADLDTALQYFELALEKDPDYASAQVGIALVWIGRRQMKLAPPREAGPKVRDAVLRAVELDDTSAEAHYALALDKAWGEWDWEAAQTAFLRAIELNPNHADVRALYAHFLMIMKRQDEAISQIEHALLLDPFNPLSKSLYGIVLAADRPDEAIAQARSVLRTVPFHPLAHTCLFISLLSKGMYEEAFEAAKMRNAMIGGPESVEALERGFAESGFQGAMSQSAATMAARASTTYIDAYDIATTYSMAGENQRALDWLERAFEEGSSNMPYMGLEIPLYGLHEEPRFQDLLRRMNFPQDVLAEYLNQSP